MVRGFVQVGRDIVASRSRTDNGAEVPKGEATIVRNARSGVLKRSVLWAPLEGAVCTRRVTTEEELDLTKGFELS